MPMRSKDELFEHELKDIYDAEHKLKGALKKLDRAIKARQKKK